jgi:hypothetical protein
MATFLGELNKDIVDTHKSLNDLNESLSVTLQNSSKWNILSRFLSGTGLWSLQNRIRAVISVMGEYRKSQMAQLETQQKSMDLLDSLATRTEKLSDARLALNEAQKSSLAPTGLRYLERLREMATTEIEVLEHLGHARTAVQTRDLAQWRTRQTEWNARLEGANKATEEITRLGEYFDINTATQAGEDEVRDILLARVEVMERLADEQDKFLTGGEIGRRISGVEEQRQNILNQRTVGGKAVGQITDYFGDLGGMIEGLRTGDTSGRRDNVLWMKMRMKKFKFFKKIDGMIRGVGVLVKSAFMFTIYAMLIIGFVGGIVALIIRYWETFEPFVKTMEFWAKQFLALVFVLWEFASEKVMSAFEKLQNGDAWGFFTDMALAVGAIMLALLVVVLGAMLMLAFAIIGGIITLAIGYLQEQMALGFTHVLTGIFKVVGGILIILGLFFGLPVIILGVLFIVVGKFLDMVFGHAAGGTVKTPFQVVGERGPELVSLPRGSRVHSNAESRRMTNGGNTNNITVQVQGRVGASDSEIRDIARKVGAQINREINRSTSSTTRA